MSLLFDLIEDTVSFEYFFFVYRSFTDILTFLIIPLNTSLGSFFPPLLPSILSASNLTVISLSVKPVFNFDNPVAFSPTILPLAWAEIVAIAAILGGNWT